MSPLPPFGFKQFAIAQTNSYDSIATVSIGSGGASSAVFSSIPSTYKSLQIRAITRTNRAQAQDVFTMRFNSDTGTNYAYHSIYGNGSAIGGNDTGTSTNLPWTGITAGNTAGANMFGAAVIDILDYQNTNKYKTSRALSGTDQNGTNGRIYYLSNLWLSTAAITTITLTPSYGTSFSQYSSFSLYGIEG